MSDFLSKFSGDKYNELLEEDQKIKKDQAEDSSSAKSPQPDPLPDERADSLLSPEASTPRNRPKTSSFSDRDEPGVAPETPKAKISANREGSSRNSSRRSTAEDTVKDPSYQEKQRRQWILAAIVGAILLALIFFIWYQFSHVSLPEFEGKSLSEARVWGAKNKIDFNPTLVFSKDYGENQILQQDPAAKKNVAKGSTIEVQVSKGADPDELISLPDFDTLDYQEAQNWVEKEKAKGLSLILQYDSEVPRFRFIKMEFRSPDVSMDSYRRKDVAIVYYSRGEEQFEKNISVPSFTGKAKSDVDSWASSNGVKVNYKESTSTTVDQGFVITQSLSSGTKIARNDPFDVTLSLGKAVLVPNYAAYSAEEASQVPGLSPLIVSRYSDFIPYGGLISQSLSPGTELTDKDDKSIKLVYSLGLPYLEDLRGKMNEGELQKYFFDTFQSKGANVTYYVEYVSSNDVKGTLIGMSSYNRILPLQFHVRLTISLGNENYYDPQNPDSPPPTVPGGNRPGK
ncbi:MAG: PASTA domain-containing protein [Tissierellia bacterium]|nr:PASTA domain-containing protein [Tissierellia bacterium]